MKITGLSTPLKKHFVGVLFFSLLSATFLKGGSREVTIKNTTDYTISGVVETLVSSLKSSRKGVPQDFDVEANTSKNIILSHNAVNIGVAKINATVINSQGVTRTIDFTLFAKGTVGPATFSTGKLSTSAITFQSLGSATSTVEMVVTLGNGTTCRTDVSFNN